MVIMDVLLLLRMTRSLNSEQHSNICVTDYTHFDRDLAINPLVLKFGWDSLCHYKDRVPADIKMMVQPKSNTSGGKY